MSPLTAGRPINAHFAGDATDFLQLISGGFEMAMLQCPFGASEGGSGPGEMVRRARRSVSAGEKIPH